MEKGLVLLAAGGTGGHLFPAEALACEIRARGYSVHLVTDSRAERFAGKFPADEIHIVQSATFASKNPVAIARTLYALWSGYRAAKQLTRRLKPQVVVGFGGYPTVPPVLAAASLDVPTLIHEQNAVMGRANKALAAKVKAIAGGFLPEGRGSDHAAKIVVTGNPVRPAVLDAARVPYAPSQAGEPFNLVVFGGSQGAQFFSQSLPNAICMMEEGLRSRLRVTQQARPDDADGVVASYAKLGVPAEVAPFFTDMADRIARAHLVICRSGASTVSELAVIGRPSVLVPYPYALDHDQAANAAALKAQGGAQVIAQAKLSHERLKELLEDSMKDAPGLAAMAAAAKLSGKPGATRLLANLVEAIASGTPVQEFKEKRS